MQNYNLPDANTNNTFNGAVFTFPGMEFARNSDVANIDIAPGFGLAPVLQLSTQSGSLEIDPANAINIVPFLVALPPGLYHWDLKITFADGRIKTYIGGKWRINPIITV